MIPIFKRGQKVWFYYHITFSDKVPMCGKILFKLPFKMKHPYALYVEYINKKCDWYFILTAKGSIVLHPEVCIEDLSYAIENHDNGDKPDENSDYLKMWNMLNEWQSERIAYLNKN